MKVKMIMLNNILEKRKMYKNKQLINVYKILLNFKVFKM